MLKRFIALGLPVLLGCGPAELDSDGDGVSVEEGDCDDADAAVNPGATEACDNKDNNCDGTIDEGFDLDNDDFTSCAQPIADCDDNSAATNPGASELCNSIDDNCDGTVDEGFDADNDNITSCGGDCDDNNPAINPEVLEACDNIDNNCDNLIDEGFDLDNDGFTTCALPTADCDDTTTAINPNATEVCDNIDNNCDTIIDEGFDLDNDGFTTCSLPTADCDDNNNASSPDSIEVCATTFDDDCDGLINEDGLDCVCIPDAVEVCYSGPANTAGVGVCQSGSATCDAQGLSLGPCLGEVLPGIENCLIAADEDCDGAAPACVGDVLAAQRFGNNAAQTGLAIRGANGNVVIAGSFDGNIDFGGGILNSLGADIFLASFDASGAHLWSKRFGDNAAQTPTRIAVDSSGNVIVTGAITGSTDFGGGSLNSAGGTDIFVAKFDAAGNHIWSRLFGNNANQLGRSVAVDSAGDVWVVGEFAGSVNFGGGVLTSSGGTDAFAAKLSGADGSALLSKRFGDAAAQSASAIAVDASDNAFFIGDFAGSINLGGSLLFSSGSTDVFLAKLDNAGSHLLSDSFGDNAAQTAIDVAVDISAQVILTGDFAGSIDFGGGLLNSAGATDVFVVALDNNGAHLWSKKFGDIQAQSARGVFADPFGAILLTGDFSGAVDFGGGNLNSAGSTDVFIAKLDPAGAHVWSFRFGDAQAQSAGGVFADESQIFLLGSFAGTMPFGVTNLFSQGITDVFLAKLTP